MSLSANVAVAQFAGKPQSSKNPAITSDGSGLPLLPGVGMPVQNQLTPEQVLGIAQLRALQSRGRGRVRTGYPQFIPMGPQGMMMPPANYSATPASTSTRKSSAEKRAEARQAREEQKKNAAGDDAKAKKAKANKTKAVKKEKPAKKDKADVKAAANK